MLSLGAISSTPFLEVGQLNATGDFEKFYGARKGEGIKEDMKMYVMTVPAGGAVLVFLALLAGLVGRGFGFLSLFLVYLTGLLCAVLLFLAVYTFRGQSQEFDKVVQNASLKKEKGAKGDIQPTMGQFLWAGLGGAVGASLSMILAALLIHHRWWSRVLSFLFLGGVTALGVVWVYRKELGIEWLDQYVPSVPFMSS
jgi:hypothetical protein